MEKSTENINASEEKCLSKEELLGYAGRSLEKGEQARVDQHLHVCEMCASAVKGFTNSETHLAMLGVLESDLEELVDVKLPSKGGFNIHQGINAILGAVIIGGGFYLFSTKKVPVVDNVPAIVEEHNEVPSLDVPAVTVVDEPNIDEQESVQESEVKVINPDDPMLPTSNERRNYATTDYMPLRQVDASKLEKHEDDKQHRARIATNTKYINDLKTYDYENIYQREHEETWYNPNLGVSAEYAHSTDVVTYENQPDSRTVWKTYEEILFNALSDYRRHKYDKALISLNLLLEDYPSDINGLFYKGLCLYYTRQYKKSIQYMVSVTADVNPTFDQEAEWFVVRAYIELGQLGTAKEQLISIIDFDGFYKNQAKKKLKGLQ